MRRAVRTRPGAHLLLALATVTCAFTAACGGGARHADPQPSDVVRSFGAVPIPFAGPSQATPTAAVGRPAILAIGGTVRANLPDPATVLITALGPEELVTARSAGAPARSTRAVITLHAAAVAESIDISDRELSSRVDTGRVIALTANGTSALHIAAGHSGTLRVTGTFASGAAQLTWTHNGHALAIWTFNIELD